MNLLYCILFNQHQVTRYLPSHFRFTKRKAIYTFDTITSTLSGYSVLCPFELIGWLAGWLIEVCLFQTAWVAQWKGSGLGARISGISSVVSLGKISQAFQTLSVFICKIGGKNLAYPAGLLGKSEKTMHVKAFCKCTALVMSFFITTNWYSSAVKPRVQKVRQLVMAVHIYPKAKFDIKTSSSKTQIMWPFPGSENYSISKAGISQLVPQDGISGMPMKFSCSWGQFFSDPNITVLQLSHLKACRLVDKKNEAGCIYLGLC